MLPNLLTTVRLLLIPVFIYFMVINQNFPLAAAIFLVSGLTDIVDGLIARKCNMVTNFGKIYDPFVDKLMQITAIVCLAISEIVPIWVIVIVILKEATMIISGGILYLKKIVVHSNWYGKACTVLFYAIMFVFILWRDMPHTWQLGLCITMVAAMIFSALAYFVDTVRHYDEKRIKGR